MVYVVTSTASHVLTVEKIKYSKKDTGDGYGCEEQNFIPWIKKNRTE